jgi:cytoskeletal protein RodZ
MIKSSLEIKTIGEILRSKRREKGLVLKQAAEVTRIRAEYLKALETGNYKIFPSEVYVKGFLKNYAKFLGIDTKKALAMYRRENNQIKEAQIQTMKVKKNRFDFTLTPEKLILVIVGIITVSIVYYIISQVSTITKRPDLSISEPIAVTAEETGNYSTEAEKINIKGKVSTGATLKLNGDNITTNNLQQFEVLDQELNPGENEFVFIAESQFGRQTRLTLIVNQIVQEPSDSEQISGQTDQAAGTVPAEETPAEITKMQMEIEIVQDIANVLVITDGQTQINEVLQPGTTRKFEAVKTIIIQTPRPAYVKVKINDQEYPIDTTSQHEWQLTGGQVKKVQ